MSDRGTILKNELKGIKDKLDKLREEEEYIKTEIGHREAQRQAYLGIQRAYGSQYIVSKTSGKYWNFTGRKSTSANLNDYRNAEHILKNVIPPEIEKLTNQLNQIKKDEHDLIIKSEQLIIEIAETSITDTGRVVGGTRKPAGQGKTVSTPTPQPTPKTPPKTPQPTPSVKYRQTTQKYTPTSVTTQISTPGTVSQLTVSDPSVNSSMSIDNYSSRTNVEQTAHIESILSFTTSAESQAYMLAGTGEAGLKASQLAKEHGLDLQIQGDIVLLNEMMGGMNHPMVDIAEREIAEAEALGITVKKGQTVSQAKTEKQNEMYKIQEAERISQFIESGGQLGLSTVTDLYTVPFPTGSRDLQLTTESANYYRNLGYDVRLTETLQPETPFTFLPEVYAEEEEDIPYLVSANFQITFEDNVGNFSSSIFVNDFASLNARVNDLYRNRGVRLVLLNTTTMQPLMSLSEIISAIELQLEQSGEIHGDPPPPTPPTTPTTPTTVTIPPPETPTTPTTVTVPPPTTPTTPKDQNWWTDSNVLIGLIAGGALVVPIFSKLFKSEKKGRR